MRSDMDYEDLFCVAMKITACKIVLKRYKGRQDVPNCIAVEGQVLRLTRLTVVGCVCV
jgi:hypothetical protein